MVQKYKKRLKGEKVYLLFLSKKIYPKTFTPFLAPNFRRFDSFLAPNFRRFNPFLAPNFRRFNLFLAPNFRKISIFAPDYQRVTNYEEISKKTYRQRT